MGIQFLLHQQVQHKKTLVRLFTVSVILSLLMFHAGHSIYTVLTLQGCCDCENNPSDNYLMSNYQQCNLQCLYKLWFEAAEQGSVFV